jgi:hypothetical protein
MLASPDVISVAEILDTHILITFSFSASIRSDTVIVATLIFIDEILQTFSCEIVIVDGKFQVEAFKVEKLPVEPLKVVVEIVAGKVETFNAEKLPVDALTVVVERDAGLKVDTLSVDALIVEAVMVVVVIVFGLKVDTLNTEKLPLEQWKDT